MTANTHSHSQENPFTSEIARHLSRHAGLDEDAVRPLLEIPPRPEMGDYTLPCFTFKEQFKKPPVEIAKDLEGAAPASGLITDIKAHGPYLNFSVDTGRLARWVLESVYAGKDSYGHQSQGA
ncbi:MAG: hypothetical protein GY800_09905, partial [Planctomycetes bacterium]|nr:hypothetical protein [Planctomycetota bacterium]